MALVTQLSVQLRNRPGELAELCTELAKKAVNISAIHASESNPVGAVRLLVSQMDVAKAICDKMGLRYTEEPALTTTVNDRPGALGKVTRKLAAKGINIDYIYATIEKGSRRALVVLGVADAAAAAKLVK